MSYTLKMTQTVREGATVFAGPTVHPWPNLDQAKLDVLVKLSDSLLPHWSKAANRPDGTLTVDLTREVTDSNGAPVAALSGSKSFIGLTRESLTDVEDHQLRVAGELLKISRDHAKAHKAKHGKK